MEENSENRISEQQRDYYLTTPELMRFLSISRSKVWDLIKNSNLPAFKLGTDYRYRYSEIIAWMERNRISGNSDH